MTTSSSEISQFYLPESRIAFIEKVKANLQSKKIVAIEGVEGIGKTALLEEVLTTTLPDGNKCYVTATQSINDIQVRSRIIEQLFGNVLFDPEMPLLNSFIEFNQPSEILIAIDNCHFLSGRIIGELLQLFSESENLGIQLTLVLAFNQSESTTLLNVNSGFLKVLPVPRLSKQESYQLMAEYIHDLPAQASPKMKRWIDNAGGIPTQLLGFNSSQQLDNTDSTPLNLKLWIALLVMTSLLLTIGIYVYRINVSKTTDTMTQNENKEIQPNVESSLLQQQVVKPWNNKANTESVGQPSINENVEEFSLNEKPIVQMVATPTASSEVIFEALTIEKPKSVARDIEQNSTTDMILAELTAEKAQRELAAKQQLDTQIEEQKTEQSDAPGKVELPNKALNQEDVLLDFFLSPEDRNEETNVDDVEPVNNTSTPNLEQEQDSENAQKLIDESQIISTASEQPQTLPSDDSYQIDNQQFMSLPANYYVLQLTAVSSSEVLAEYLSSAPVSVEQLRIYQVSRNNTDWIVVTHGLFETIEQARAEAKKVAPNSWAKSISVIQQQILSHQTILEKQ